MAIFITIIAKLIPVIVHTGVIPTFFTSYLTISIAKVNYTAAYIACMISITFCIGTIGNLYITLIAEMIKIVIIAPVRYTAGCK